MLNHQAGKRTVFLIIMVLTCLLTIQAACAEWKGTVRGGWLILRSSPSFQGRQLSSYPTGTVVTITAKSGAWYAVKAPDGLSGYMYGSYLKVTGGSQEDITLGKEAWVTSTNGMNVRLRSGPGTQYPAIASYAPGTKCEVISKEGSFHKIRIGTLTGYMMTKYLTGINPGDSTVVPEGYTVYVTSRNGQGVNMRSGPSTSYSVIGFFAVGTKATMISSGNTWSKIAVGSLVGYMKSIFLTTRKPETPEPDHDLSGSYVYSPNGRYVNLRKGPGLNYRAITSYPNGTPLTVITRAGEWCFIKIGETYGYMMSQYIREKELIFYNQ